MPKIKKTNAMRILDQRNITYDIISYDVKDGKIDGLAVAKKINRGPQIVYKTLVARGKSGEIFVFIIPVGEELDLKCAAKAVGEKKIEMVAVKEILNLTGYIRGGCSPVGMKREYRSFIEKSALKNEKIIVSGGKIGLQIELLVADLAHVIAAKFADLIKDEKD